MNKIITLPRVLARDAVRNEPEFRGVRTNGVYVIFTSPEATLAAARAADDLAAAMNAPLTVVHFRPVPYALPLTERTRIPNMETEALASQLRKEGITADVCVYLCRSEHDAAVLTLRPHSLVFVGGRHAWWPLTRAARWRRALEAAGHVVVAVDASHYRAHGHQISPVNHQITQSPNHQITKSPDHQIPVAAFRRGLVGRSMKERARA